MVDLRTMVATTSTCVLRLCELSCTHDIISTSSFLDISAVNTKSSTNLVSLHFGAICHQRSEDKLIFFMNSNIFCILTTACCVVVNSLCKALNDILIFRSAEPFSK